MLHKLLKVVGTTSTDYECYLQPNLSRYSAAFLFSRRPQICGLAEFKPKLFLSRPEIYSKPAGGLVLCTIVLYNCTYCCTCRLKYKLDQFRRHSYGEVRVELCQQALVTPHTALESWTLKRFKICLCWIDSDVEFAGGTKRRPRQADEADEPETAVFHLQTEQISLCIALKIITRATTINRTLYAGPAWWGYANASDKEGIQRFLDRIYKSGFLTEQDTGIESQMTVADQSCAPTSMCRRRRAGQFRSAAAARRRSKKSAAAARRGRPKTFFSKIQDKISFYPQHFLRNFFSHQSFEVCR